MPAQCTEGGLRPEHLVIAYDERSRICVFVPAQSAELDRTICSDRSEIDVPIQPDQQWLQRFEILGVNLLSGLEMPAGRGLLEARAERSVDLPRRPNLAQERLWVGEDKFPAFAFYNTDVPPREPKLISGCFTLPHLPSQLRDVLAGQVGAKLHRDHELIDICHGRTVLPNPDRLDHNHMRLHAHRQKRTSVTAL